MRGNGKKRMWKRSFKMWSDICGGGLKSEQGSFLEASLQNNIIKIISIIYFLFLFLLLLLLNFFFLSKYHNNLIYLRSRFTHINTCSGCIFNFLLPSAYKNNC